MAIKLHKDFGLNPTISKCILCQKEKNEIALLGSSYKEQAPMYMVTSIEPCKECKEKYLKHGVMLVEAEIKPHGYVQQKFDYVPNGNISVIKDNAFKKLFNQEIPNGKICFVEIGLLTKIGALNVKEKEQ